MTCRHPDEWLLVCRQPDTFTAFEQRITRRPRWHDIC
jgi:hypothetical protein